jgi:phenylacetate-CoA ligase
MASNESFEKFKKILKFVYKNQYSDFYRAKYKKTNFNPLSDFESIKDIEKIPFLIRKELENINPLKLLFIGEKEGTYVHCTSGTTGKPVFIFYSKFQPLHILDDFGIHFGKVLLLRNVLGGSNNPIQAYKDDGCQILTGDIHNIPASCNLASEFGVNSILTTPTLAIILSDYLQRYPKLRKTLRFLLLSGEPVSIYKKKVLRKLYPNLEIFILYGSQESGRIGFQCRFLSKRTDQIYLHSRIEANYLEVMNADTGKKVAIGEKGELVLTSLQNLATPLIRYKTGDLVSFKKNDCPCKFPGPLLQFWGRKNYDIVKAGGIEFRSHMLEKPLLNLRNYLKEDFEAHFYENYIYNKPKITIKLNLSLREGVEDSQLLKQKIKTEFLENWQLSARLNLNKAIEAGIIEPLQINFVKFPQSAKSKKFLILH